MVNTKKVRLMTQLAYYETNEGKKDIAVGRYFRSDYMSLQLLKSLIGGTVAFGLVAAVYLVYHMDTFLQEIYKMDILAFAKHYLWIYVAFIGVYLVITYGIYAYRYFAARRNMKEYMARLHQLEHSYDE